MFLKTFLKGVIVVFLFVFVVSGSSAWAAARVAYIYNTDTASRDDFDSFLTSRNFVVDIVPLSGADTFDFSADQAIIIGDDTGYWGTLAAVTNVNGAGKPIMGIGEGGSHFFDQLSLDIGWLHAASSTRDDADVVDSANPVWNSPLLIPNGGSGSTVTLYSSLIEVWAIWYPSAVPGVTGLAGLTGEPNYYCLINQVVGSQCYTFWGFRSSSSPASMTSVGKDLFYNVLARPCGGSILDGLVTTYTYYIPYYKADPFDYYSSLALRNSSTTSAATVTVAAYESDGTPVPLAAAFAGFAIDPSGQWAQVLPRTEVEGWIRVTSTQPLTGLAWVGKLDGAWPRLMADITLIDELHATLVVPHVAQTIAGWNPDGGWSTKVNVCNPHTTATDVTITYYTTAGASPHTTTLSIPANGSVSYNLASLLPTDQSFDNGSTLITATQTVAAFALYYDVDKVPGGDGTCYAGISAVAPGAGATGSYSYYIPYYMADPDDYYSSLALRNSSTTTAATVTVAAYESNGTVVPLGAGFTGFTIDPSGQWAEVLPRATTIEGWVMVTSTQPLTGLAWVGKLDVVAWPRLMADVTLIGELNGTLVVPHVAQTVAGYNPDGGWSTKVNVCNPHATATDVTISYYTTAGATPHTTTLSIPANGSVSYNLASFLPAGQSFDNGSTLITATQTVAAFALYYDVDKVPGGDGTCYAGISAVAP